MRRRHLKELRELTCCVIPCRVRGVTFEKSARMLKIHMWLNPPYMGSQKSSSQCLCTNVFFDTFMPIYESRIQQQQQQITLHKKMAWHKYSKEILSGIHIILDPFQISCKKTTQTV